MFSRLGDIHQLKEVHAAHALEREFNPIIFMVNQALTVVIFKGPACF